MPETDEPILSKRIFRDVNFKAMDYSGKASSFSIERVFERDGVGAIRQCRRYDGDEKIKTALLNAKALSEPNCILPAPLLANR